MFGQHAHKRCSFEVGPNASGYRVFAGNPERDDANGSLTAVIRLPPDQIAEASVTISNDNPTFGTTMRHMAARVAVHPETTIIEWLFGNRLTARTILDEHGCGTIYVQGSGRRHTYFVHSLYDEVTA